ncbi:hypothetical protein HNP48_002860 [Acidovorax soli]|uniref:Uncharacterized protein n=1 Tax=Acidovorax soli TaxID=592050 RepID=A0A7X0PE74_9BURK|nr:hypothetical protein [Acidovorax soli]MBB6560186.1 hypothetical protein [Acidovorax soli]
MLFHPSALSRAAVAGVCALALAALSGCDKVPKPKAQEAPPPAVAPAPAPAR